MLTIPLAENKNQELTVILNGQACKIIIYENSTGLYLDLWKNGIVVRTSILCLDRVKMLTGSYHGFIGKLMFEDTQGRSEPTVAELGSRYQLRYLFPGE